MSIVEHTIVEHICEEIWSQGDEERIPMLERVLQTQPGGYGAGDQLCGARVPILRLIAKKYANLALEETEALLHEELHEARFVALVILMLKFKSNKKDVLDLYLRNTNFVNNWDLVDVSAPNIVGRFCCETNDHALIRDLANSNNLWENRIAIVSTMTLVRANNCDLTLKICEQFLHHKHHLIHKACGWMLREVGKKDEVRLINFLQKFATQLPKITISYAKERLPHDALQHKKPMDAKVGAGCKSRRS